jgi:twitching motility two-component system response regulator PilH
VGVNDANRGGLRLLERPLSTARTPADARACHPSQRGRPVLYVGGEVNDRLVFTRIARRWRGVELVVADSAEEGLDIALSPKPRMVVLDSLLTDVDADEFVVALRSGAPASTVPILVLGHDKAPLVQARFLWAGASAYIAKPLLTAEVDLAVGLLLETASTR